jgi:hypothetical protein
MQTNETRTDLHDGGASGRDGRRHGDVAVAQCAPARRLLLERRAEALLHRAAPTDRRETTRAELAPQLVEVKARKLIEEGFRVEGRFLVRREAARRLGDRRAAAAARTARAARRPDLRRSAAPHVHRSRPGHCDRVVRSAPDHRNAAAEGIDRARRGEVDARAVAELAARAAAPREDLADVGERQRVVRAAFDLRHEDGGARRARALGEEELRDQRRRADVLPRPRPELASVAPAPGVDFARVGQAHRVMHADLSKEKKRANNRNEQTTEI